MKRSILMATVSIIVLISVVLWYYKSGGNLNMVEMLQFVIVILIVGFGFYFAWKRLKSARKGEPGEDELSRKVLQKTAATSYYISLYIWVVMIYVKDRITTDVEVLMGTGIILMSLVFVIGWIFYHFKGIKE